MECSRGQTDQTEPNQQSVASLGREAVTLALSVGMRSLEPQVNTEAGTSEM